MQNNERADIAIAKKMKNTILQILKNANYE